MLKIKDEIFDYFPLNVEVPNEIMQKAEEIRVRLGQAILIKYQNQNGRVVSTRHATFNERTVF